TLPSHSVGSSTSSSRPSSRMSLAENWMKATMARELNLVIQPGPSKPWALSIYALLLAAFLASAPSGRLAHHTRYNHHALQAEAWLSGRLDLGGPPPAYTGRNDFAVFEGKTYVSFPPVPALLLVPAV